MAGDMNEIVAEAMKHGETGSVAHSRQFAVASGHPA